MPESARIAIEKRIQELDCPATWVKPAIDLGKGFAEYQLNQNGAKVKYKLPLLGKIQLMNSAIAIATLEILQHRRWQISETAIQNGIAKTQWPGRLQQTTWKNQTILIDGAHNPAAAIALREYVDNLNTSQVPINWVIGIIATKDCDDILKALLKKGDRLYLVPVPDQNSASPTELATLAQTICPELTLCQTFPELTTALDAAVAEDNLTVLCGSLYLVGHFLQQQKSQV